MRVIVPYVTLHPATQHWIDTHAPHAELVQLPASLADASGYNEHLPECAYWRLVRDLWASGDDFMLVEHDIQPFPDSEQAFTDCPNDWCVYPYLGDEAVWTSRQRQGDTPRVQRPFRCALGCTRFRATLTAKHPLALEHMRHKHWRRIDSQLASFLFQHGEKTCEHQPHVTHHHDYQNDPLINRWQTTRA